MPTVEHTRTGAPPRRVLVTGSRTWANPALIRDALARVWGEGDAVLVTTGAATGADRIAEMFWRRWGGRVEHHPTTAANHDQGQPAGPVAAGVDVCLAFLRDDCPQASQTVSWARAAGIPTQLHTDPSCHRPTDERGGEPDHRAAAEEAAGESADPAETTDGDVEGRGAPVSVEQLSPRELAARYSYPVVARLVARAPADSLAGQVGRRALELLLHNPGIYTGGDQAAEIARWISPAELARQRQIIGYGPLFEVMGQAAQLQHATAAARADDPPVAGDDTANDNADGDAVRAARQAVDALTQRRAGDRENAETEHAEQISRWQRDDQVQHYDARDQERALMTG